MKNPLVNLFIVMFLICLVFIFFNTRKTIGYVNRYSISFIEKNIEAVKDLEYFISEKKLLADTITNAKIVVYGKSSMGAYITYKTINGEIHNNIETPSFLKKLTEGNKMRSISITKECIKFHSIFSTWGMKNCSLYYFFKPIDLKKDSIYLNRYLIIDSVNNLKPELEYCLPIKPNWILIISNE